MLVSSGKVAVSCVLDDAGSADDGTITLTTTGGTGAYTYDWADVAGTDNDADRTDLADGTYTVTVTDENGCVASETFTIEDPAPLDVTGMTTDVTCIDDNGSADDGTITITATGGTGAYTYNWPDVAGTDNDPNRTGLADGTYTVTVTDENGCVASESFDITDPAPLDVTGMTTDVTCNDDAGSADDGTIDITATGGTGAYTYDWADLAGNDDPADRTDLAAGTYTVTVMDENGCVASESFEIEAADALDVSGETTDVSCIDDNGSADDGTITLTVTGGSGVYTYNWADVAGNDNDADRTDLADGTYTVTVTDESGCSAVREFTITDPEMLDVSGVDTDVTCNDDNGTSDIVLTYYNEGVPYPVRGRQCDTSTTLWVNFARCWSKSSLSRLRRFRSSQELTPCDS